MKTGRLMGAILASAGVLSLGSPSSVRAVCPADPCDCLGAARGFDAVSSEQMNVIFGKLHASGYSYRVQTEVEGAVCGSLTTVGGSADDAPTTVGDVVGRAGPGTNAVKFKGVRVSGILDPGVEVLGDVVTGGGLIVNQSLAIIDNDPGVDVSGTHPLMLSCTQALSDLTATATTLAGLTPTQNFPDGILAGDGEASTTVITTADGLNVISAPEVKVVPKSVSGYPEGSELSIDMVAGATLVVINTPKLKVGTASMITVGGAGADPSKVIINVTSLKGVAFSQESVVEPIILATQSAVTVGAAATSSAVYGRKVNIKGATVSSESCSPSGAFLDGESPLF